MINTDYHPDIVVKQVRITPEIAQRIAQEIADDPAGRGYAGKTTEEQYLLFVSPYEIPNPEPQGRVPRGEWLPDELKNHLLQVRGQDGLSVWAKLELMRESQDIATKAFATEVLATFSLKAINMQNPYVMAGLQQLASAGILTPSMMTELTTMPDPSWRPVIVRPPRAWEVVGPIEAFGAVSSTWVPTLDEFVHIVEG
ncbi:MAG: hypothetical protein WHU10_00010 [Fimbriimonadales bacterium]